MITHIHICVPSDNPDIPQTWPTVDRREHTKDKGGGGDEKEEAEKKTGPDREKGTQETMKRGKGRIAGC